MCRSPLVERGLQERIWAVVGTAEALEAPSSVASSRASGGLRASRGRSSDQSRKIWVSRLSEPSTPSTRRRRSPWKRSGDCIPCSRSSSKTAHASRGLSLWLGSPSVSSSRSMWPCCLCDTWHRFLRSTAPEAARLCSDSLVERVEMARFRLDCSCCKSCRYANKSVWVCIVRRDFIMVVCTRA